MKENEIRPKKILDEYLALVEQDSKKLNPKSFVHIDCPACGSREQITKFIKNSFPYSLCQDCGTLFCNPRPTEETLKFFYESAESSLFWSNVFFPSVIESRREKLFKPKAKRIYDYLTKRQFNPTTICDVGSGYGIFLEELSSFFPKAKLYGIEPSPEMAEISRKKGIETLVATAEESSLWSGNFDLVISSEVIEHAFSPKLFLTSIHKLLKKDGYLILTGLGYEGFDILTLQENSKSIFPPHHLNFMSIAGFSKILATVGFSESEVMTPGELDVDICLNSGIDNEFLRVLRSRGEKAISEFQEFLKANQLSSHIWAIGKN